MDKLIVIEGACDGVGKSTQFQLLCDRLRQEGFNVASHHFPSYDTYQASPVEHYLKGEYGLPNELSPYFINSLYALDRAITWQVKLKNLYDQNNLIVLDRYTTSSLIYQSSLIEDENQKKAFIDYVMDFEYNKLQIQKPDKVIFLYAPFELIQNLRNKRQSNDGIQNDIHEKDVKYLKKTYDNAVFVAKYLNWTIIDCYSDNKMKSIEEIHEEIYSQMHINTLH